jgi:ribonuclease G
MSKELVISATPHETRVAIVEDGQLCEFYVEREKEFALVGSIYKGRVTRVLPGMQSAFVDIGLDGDAFLYVSDFLEDLEEYDQIVNTVEEKIQKMEQQGGQLFPPSVNGAVLEPPEVNGADLTTAPPVAESPVPGRRGTVRGGYENRRFSRGRDRGGRGRGGRRHGRWERRGPRGHELPPSKFVHKSPADYEPVILPGESLAKYKDRIPSPPPEEPTAPAEALTAVAPEEFSPVEPLAGTKPNSESASSALEPSVPAPTFAAEVVSEPAVAPELPPEPPAGSAPQTVSSAAPPEPRVHEPPRSVPESEWPFSAPASTSPTVGEPPAVESESVPEAGEESIGPVSAELAEGEAGVLAAQLAEARREELERETELETEELVEAAEADFGEEVAEGEEALPENGMTEVSAFLTEAEEPPPESALDEAGAAERSVRVRHDRSMRFQRPARREDRRAARARFRLPPQRVPRRTQSISELLKPGQEIIVQIAKEPLGKKGARITSHIALPGRYLVYMPTLDHIGVSRKISSAEQRARLRQLLRELKGNLPGGFIVRTAAATASEDDLRADVEFLGHLWQEIRQRAEERRAPALLHRDLNLVERVLRDQLSGDFTAIWVDNEDEFARVVEFVNRFQPRLVNRVKLYSKGTPIFEEFGIQAEIDKALRPKVWLKSGGYIVINHTEALVAIDVNTGKFVGKGSTRLEDTIVKTNLEAVKEIVRQIRLRDLGGIIVIDFIDMEERKNRNKVMQALEEALRSDKAPSKVLSFNEFGLVAITRKRTKQALERMLTQPCPYCSGSGMVKSIPTICYEIQMEARKMAPELDSNSITLRVHPEIAKALKTRESILVEELEQWTRKSVIIQSDPTLHWEQYDIY